MHLQLLIRKRVFEDVINSRTSRSSRSSRTIKMGPKSNAKCSLRDSEEKHMKGKRQCDQGVD